MVTLDSWQEQGFAAIAQEYLARLAPDGEKGIRRDIDENGDLLVRRMGKNDAGAAQARWPRWQSRPGSIRRPEGRARVKLLAHHPA